MTTTSQRLRIIVYGAYDKQDRWCGRISRQPGEDGWLARNSLLHLEQGGFATPEAAADWLIGMANDIWGSNAFNVLCQVKFCNNNASRVWVNLDLVKDVCQKCYHEKADGKYMKWK